MTGKRFLTPMLLLVAMAVPNPTRAAERPTPANLEGGYVIFKNGDDRPGGCSVTANPDGTFTLSNEFKSQATARPTPGNPYRVDIVGWAPNCSFATIMISEHSVRLVFANKDEWIKDR